jgi:hypothetical protein
MPWNAEKGMCWVAAGMMSLLALFLIAAGSGILLFVVGTWKLRVHVCEKRFYCGASAGVAFPWDEIALVRETQSYERPPVLNGAAKLLLPEIMSSSYLGRRRDGKEFAFSKNSIRETNELGRIIEGESRKRGIRYEIVEEHKGKASVVGSKLNVCDVSSKYAQRRKGFYVERLDHFGEEENAWREVLIQDHTAGPAEVAATRIDFAAWLKQLPSRTRKITKLLATGEKTSIVAQKFDLSSGRISQLRNELAHSWKVFQQEAVSTSLFRRSAANPAV